MHVVHTHCRKRHLKQIAHPRLERRAFLVHLSSSAVAAALLLQLEPCRVEAAEVAADDARLHTERVTVPNGAGGLLCYLAQPLGHPGKLGAVVVVHNNLGPTPHFEDVARRLALEGFTVLLPDYGSRMGGTPTEEEPARAEIGMLTWDEVVTDSQAAIAWLKARGDGDGKVGMAGFGWGGSATGRVTTKVPDLDAAAVFYGRVPPLSGVAAIKARLLLNYAGEDQGVGAEVPAFLDALGKAGVGYEVFTYEGTQRGFDDETAPAHYAPDAAKLAWSRMIDFLRQALT